MKAELGAFVPQLKPLEKCPITSVSTPYKQNDAHNEQKWLIMFNYYLFLSQRCSVVKVARRYGCRYLKNNAKKWKWKCLEPKCKFNIHPAQKSVGLVYPNLRYKASQDDASTPSAFSASAPDRKVDDAAFPSCGFNFKEMKKKTRENKFSLLYRSRSPSVIEEIRLINGIQRCSILAFNLYPMSSTAEIAVSSSPM